MFTDRFTAGGKKKEPSGMHVFDRLCKQLGIEHRLILPRHPHTNGMVERFNGRVSDIVNQTRFGSAAELESTLRNYVKIYNHSIPQRALDHKTLIQALKDWHEKQPELFRKRTYNQAGLNSYHRRSLVETKMRCFKLLGKRVMARDFNRQVAELQVRAAILNRFTRLGMPTTVAVDMP